jgi:hypothetical protein
MKVKTLELEGPALDWAVAVCESVECDADHNPIWFEDDGPLAPRVKYSPSTDGSQAVSIIDREGINTSVDYQDCVLTLDMVRIGWKANLWNNSIPGTSGFLQWAYGPTLLVAAMRCFVACKLGKEVDVPDELVAHNHRDAGEPHTEVQQAHQRPRGSL